MLWTLRFLLIEKFTGSCVQEKNTEDLSEKGSVDLSAYAGKDKSAYTASDHSGKYLPEIQIALMSAEQARDHRAGKKEEKIDSPGSFLGLIQHCGKPKHQQAAASYTNS